MDLKAHFTPLDDDDDDNNDTASGMDGFLSSRTFHRGVVIFAEHSDSS